MTESPYYTVAEVMALLKLSRSTLKRRLAAGPAHDGFTRLTGGPFGRGVRIPRAEVDSLMPRRRRRAA